MKTSKPFKLRSQGLPFKEMGSSPLNEGFGVLASDANKEEAFNTRLDLDKKVESNVTANKESQEANDESWWGSMKNKAKQAYDSIDVNKGLDNLQTGLTAAGMVPGVGNAVDLLNAGISGGRATYAKATGDDEAAKKYAIEGATNLAAAAPGAGLAVGAAKLSSKAVKAAKTTEKASDVTENVAKVAKTKKTLEKSSKVADATTGGAQLASNNEKKQDKPNNNKPKDNKPKEKKKVDKPKIAKVDKKKDKGGSDKA